jgi:hypothetical protein
MTCFRRSPPIFYPFTPLKKMNKSPAKIIISHVGRDKVIRIPERTIDRRPVIEPVAVCLSTAARMYSLSVPTLTRFIKEGKLPAKKIGHKVMILTKNLKEFIGGEK